MWMKESKSISVERVGDRWRKKALQKEREMELRHALERRVVYCPPNLCGTIVQTTVMLMLSITRVPLSLHHVCCCTIH